MGWSYTNVALRGPSQQQVAKAVGERRGVVSPTTNNFTLFADQEFDSHEENKIITIAAQLSTRLACPALVIMEFDDDVLHYRLIEAGTVVDEYNSCPDYFDFAATNVPPRGPIGGNATRLATVLGNPDSRERIESILRKNDITLSAPKRHRDLAQ